MPDLATPFINGANAGQMLQQSAQRTQAGQMALQEQALKLQQDQKFNALLGQMAQPGGGNPQPGGQDSGEPSAKSASDQMLNLGMLALKSGLPQGVALVNNAITAQTKLAEAASRQVTAQAAQTRAQAAAAKEQSDQFYQQVAPVAGALDTVHDEASWNQFTQYMQKQFGDTEYLGQPYNPQVVSGLKFQLMGVKNALAAKNQEALRAQKEAEMQARQQHNTVMERLAAARNETARVAAEARQVQAEARAKREAALGKVGGGRVVSTPPQNMIDQAQDMIKRELPDMQDTDSLDFSYSVASQARALMQQNPGMNAQAAIMESLQEQKDQYVKTVPGAARNPIAELFYGKSKPKTVFEPKGVSQASAQRQAPQKNAPAVGTVMEGYRFKGGDHSQQSNWEKVQ